MKKNWTTNRAEQAALNAQLGVAAMGRLLPNITTAISPRFTTSW